MSKNYLTEEHEMWYFIQHTFLRNMFFNDTYNTLTLDVDNLIILIKQLFVSNDLEFNYNIEDFKINHFIDEEHTWFVTTLYFPELEGIGLCKRIYLICKVKEDDVSCGYFTIENTLNSEKYAICNWDNSSHFVCYSECDEKDFELEQSTVMMCFQRLYDIQS